ncbi:hypothetical protein FND52_03625 [Atlantibacter subterranea]|uniref:hypothetical protein n=1 Tax=Atlantibacter subterraneus TaxID=255519 RepID=UPI0011836486|nr:hypothetical protein [Atlantibacter subterranea]TSJ59532.1 hypothetical protein FND52_03625 [Atlantibacter subterranea]UTJ49292.1 hypothetical protein NLZ15_09900 [Atlantibacter subterranea]
MSLFLSSFIFEKKEYDDEFYQLDALIESYTLSLPGFIGMESVTDTASGKTINNYYWHNREDMDKLMTEISHKKAKGQSQKWIKGYQVIVAEIQGAHNARLDHPLAAFPLPYLPSR